MTHPLCSLPAGRVPQGAGGLKWRPGPCVHSLEVVGGTISGLKVVKCGPGSPQGVAEGGGAAKKAPYLPTPQSGRAAVGVSVQRLQFS